MLSSGDREGGAHAVLKIKIRQVGINQFKRTPGMNTTNSGEVMIAISSDA